MQHKTRRLTKIYHSDDDDVGDGYNLLSPLCLSVCLSLPLPLPKTAVSSQNVLRFLSTMFGLLLLLATAKSGFLQHYGYYKGLVLSTDLRVFNFIADFMGCSMNLTVAGQRLSVQNSIVVLFPDIFMNFWLLSYRNLNRYVI